MEGGFSGGHLTPGEARHAEIKRGVSRGIVGPRYGSLVLAGRTCSRAATYLVPVEAEGSDDRGFTNFAALAPGGRGRSSSCRKEWILVNTD